MSYIIRIFNDGSEKTKRNSNFSQLKCFTWKSAVFWKKMPKSTECFSNPFIVANIYVKFHKQRITAAISDGRAEWPPSSSSLIAQSI